MDREEAIKWLKQIKDKYIRGGDEFFDESRKQALDMAIESLSAEPTDLISRADAVEAMWKALYAYEEELEQKFIQDPNVDYADYPVSRLWVQNGRDVCHKAILSLHSADRPSGEWIPIEEREPDTMNHVLVTIKWSQNDYEVMEIDYHMTKFLSLCEKRTKTTWAQNIMKNIIAWKHMPEPYRGNNK